MIVLGTFGVLALKTHGTVPTGYLLALVALLFTAMSYGKMSARFPVAGSAYTYTRRAEACAQAGFAMDRMGFGSDPAASGACAGADQCGRGARLAGGERKRPDPSS